MSNENVFAKLLMYTLVRFFLAAWFVDIVYDVFAPADFPHFTYWTALWMVTLFHIIVGSLRQEELKKESQ